MTQVDAEFDHAQKKKPANGLPQKLPASTSSTSWLTSIAPRKQFLQYGCSGNLEG
jgi:hypothetical protein